MSYVDEVFDAADEAYDRGVDRLLEDADLARKQAKENPSTGVVGVLRADIDLAVPALVDSEDGQILAVGLTFKATVHADGNVRWEKTAHDDQAQHAPAGGYEWPAWLVDAALAMNQQGAIR